MRMTAITPKNAFTRIESNFWIMLVALLDSSALARKLAPTAYWVIRRVRKLVWVFTAAVLAIAGLTFGFVAGLIAAKILGAS